QYAFLLGLRGIKKYAAIFLVHSNLAVFWDDFGRLLMLLQHHTGLFAPVFFYFILQTFLFHFFFGELSFHIAQLLFIWPFYIGSALGKEQFIAYQGQGSGQVFFVFSPEQLDIGTFYLLHRLFIGFTLYYCIFSSAALVSLGIAVENIGKDGTTKFGYTHFQYRQYRYQ